ncbi:MULTISPECIES: NACHT domain-containing protein [Leptolyngbya]|uniref:NACHT domain-containing protein n=1 Tax=Leptolyngbya TaxID=47251 RepID=UPI001689241C|nr:hypothetical protein [Leptolyngbya sp. FACHB-1624]MBD1857732.1 hypothetical protein [Leptolyngbya sp. FACHB-1624]
MASQDQNIGGDINNSEVDLTQAGRDLKQIAGDDRSTTIYQTFLQTFPQPGKKWDDRQSRILAKMQEDVIARLDFTLNDDDVLIPLRMKSYGANSSKASLKLRRKLKTEGQEEVDLDLNEAIVKVFCRKDVRKKLLILGAPGAGKTTTLLTLARDLLAGAIENPGSVIPIIFELSTWKTGKIEDWLVQQLRSGFDLAEDQGKAWIDKQLLLPLMDGLDELGIEQQTQCIAALNEFASGYPHLVVCCRVQEYEDAGANLRAMPGQICLQSLSEAQIQQYLQEIELDSLWQAIQTSAEMRQMLQPDKDGNPGIFQVPLLLSIAAEAYDGQPFSSREELYEAFIQKRLQQETREIERQFRRKQKKQWAYDNTESEPGFKETRKVLAWFAQHLKTHEQIEILIEGIQPHWLEIARLRYQYQLVFGLVCVLFMGLVTAIIYGLIYGLVYGLWCGLIFGLPFGLVVGLVNRQTDITPIEMFHIAMSQKLPKKVMRTLWKLLIDKPINSGFVITLSILVIVLQSLNKKLLLLLDRLSDIYRRIPKVLNKKRIWYASFRLLMTFLFRQLLIALMIPAKLILRITNVSIDGLTSAANKIKKIENIVHASQKKIQLRAKPNQGIWNSRDSFFLLTFLVCPILVLLVYPILVVIYISPELIRQIAQGLDWKVLFSRYISSSLLPASLWQSIFISFLFGGGVVCLQHFCLRLVLWQNGIAPWNISKFLNYCTERRLLQNLSGRYRFLHRELLDYFATLRV